MQTVQFMDFVQVLLDCSAKMNVRMLSAVAVFSFTFNSLVSFCSSSSSSSSVSILGATIRYNFIYLINMNNLQYSN